MSATLIVHQYDASHGIPNVSPFCAKLETWLRLHGIPFEVALTDHPSGAPKKKAPWVTLPSGEDLGDTTFIIERLASEYGIELDPHLSARERAVAQAFKGMVEDHLYFAVTWLHFYWEPGWTEVKAIMMQVPAALRPVATFFLRRGVRQQCWYQGMGRHTFDELCDLAVRDVTALEEMIEGPWFFGDEPSTLDATVFGALSGLSRLQIDSPVHHRVQASDVLMGYCERIASRYYGHLAQPLAA